MHKCGMDFENNKVLGLILWFVLRKMFKDPTITICTSLTILEYAKLNVY